MLHNILTDDRVIGSSDDCGLAGQIISLRVRCFTFWEWAVGVIIRETEFDCWYVYKFCQHFVNGAIVFNSWTPGKQCYFFVFCIFYSACILVYYITRTFYQHACHVPTYNFFIADFAYDFGKYFDSALHCYVNYVENA